MKFSTPDHVCHAATVDMCKFSALGVEWGRSHDGVEYNIENSIFVSCFFYNYPSGQRQPPKFPCQFCTGWQPNFINFCVQAMPMPM